MKIVWERRTELQRKLQKKGIGDRAAAAVRAALCACAVLGWWGILYPELTLTPDTYAIVGEETVQGEGREEEWSLSGSIYRDLLEAEDGQIHLKSRLLQKLRSASLSRK